MGRAPELIQRYVDQINLITGRDDAVTRTIIRHFNGLLLAATWSRP